MTKLTAVAMTVLMMASTVAAKSKPSVCDDPSADACTVWAAHNATLIKAALKNPDSFALAKVAVTGKGDICYRYSAQNGLGGTISAVAVWFHSGVPLAVTLNIQPRQLLGNDIVDDLQDNGNVTKACGSGTPLDIEKVNASVANTGSTATF